MAQGAGYNPYTMKERSPEPDDDDTSTSGSDSSSSAREWRDESFRCGRFCADRAQTFHEFWRERRFLSCSVDPQSWLTMRASIDADWSHEVFYSLQDAVEKKRDRSIPLPRPGKKPKQAIVDRLRVDADRLTEKTKALAQEMWDDFVRREKVRPSSTSCEAASAHLTRSGLGRSQSTTMAASKRAWRWCCFLVVYSADRPRRLHI